MKAKKKKLKTAPPPFRNPGVSPGGLCRLLTDPVQGVAPSQVDLVEMIEKWAGAQDPPLPRVSIATVKHWSSPKWGDKPAPTRRLKIRVGPFEVLVRFAKAHGVRLPA